MSGAKGRSGRRAMTGERADMRFNARVTPALYALLSAAAGANGRSLTQEITERLVASFNDGRLSRMGRNLSEDYAAVMFNG